MMLLADSAHPGGTGPTRPSEIAPERPALLPLVKLKLTCADVQLAKVTVAVPT
jgi:hypothetical protein